MNTNEDLSLIPLKSYEKRAQIINSEIQKIRHSDIQYIVESEQPRFSNGEAKVKLLNSVRGKDVFILCDISNYSITYNMFGLTQHLSPDEHFMDIKRTISAISGKAKRITVIMPLLYESRQHRKNGRESMDCALALQELSNLGVNEIVTFDAHDPNIQNALYKGSFDSIKPFYLIFKTFIDKETAINKDNSIIISPDSGAMARAVTYASILGCEVGLFYKRRDYSVVVNGKNPILTHEYVGTSMKDKYAIIVDDMLASGDSIIDIALKVKEMGAKGLYAIVTFAFFTEGINKFKALYESGFLKRVYCTNLSYIPKDYENLTWLEIVDFNKFIALIINSINNDESISKIIDSSAKMDKLINKIYKKGE